MDNEAWTAYVGKIVVVDTTSNYVYLGTLAEVKDHFVTMIDVDVHDRGEGLSTKEKYIMEVKRFGVKPNRKEVSVRKSVIVSLSKMDDILTY